MIRPSQSLIIISLGIIGLIVIIFGLLLGFPLYTFIGLILEFIAFQLVLNSVFIQLDRTPRTSQRWSRQNIHRILFIIRGALFLFTLVLIAYLITIFLGSFLQNA